MSDKRGYFGVTDPTGKESWFTVGKDGKILIRNVDVTAHKARHQAGGEDEINVDGLSGELADHQKAKLSFVGLKANFPSPGTVNRLAFATDEGILYRDTGTLWEKVGVINHGDLGGIGPSDHHVKTTDAAEITSGRFPLSRLPDGTAGYVLTAQGAGNDPVYQAISSSKVTSGSYTGDGTANRAIAHGLGVTPKIVLISGVNGYYGVFHCQGGYVFTYSYRHTVTAPDATSFYVGNSSNYEESANYSGYVYYWTAIG